MNNEEVHISAEEILAYLDDQARPFWDLAVTRAFLAREQQKNADLIALVQELEEQLTKGNPLNMTPREVE